MPAFVTHNKILKESIAYLAKKKRKSYLARSIEALFNSPEYLGAGLFGAMGPDIFDYLPARSVKAPFGSDLSFFIHDGQSFPMISSMIQLLCSYPDKHLEWTSYQRAYLYGFISHIVSDAVFHPFIFFFSGFPESSLKKERNYYREQNLLFYYNLDNYFLYDDEQALDFNIDEMLPLQKGACSRVLNPAVKAMLFHALKECFPDRYESLFMPVLKKGNREAAEQFTKIDLIPYCIKKVYRLKFSKNKRIKNAMRSIRRRNIFLSDHLIYYPEKKQMNRHVLNFHKERWQYPVEKPGFRYESINGLLSNACEEITEIWEKIEASLFDGIDTSVFNDIRMNAYTGVENEGYYTMKHAMPVRLRY